MVYPSVHSCVMFEALGAGFMQYFTSSCRAKSWGGGGGGAMSTPTIHDTN